ncbi:cytochrome P450 [Daedaleopsis nitida]|nr:cytochrome P450 [Daedaleopsis nitida]
MLSFLFRSSSKHLPPGPPGQFIIGNLNDIPKTDQWEYFYKQSQIYGSDINTYHVLNKTIIILNSRESIEALFNKQADDYSDKPPRKMANISDLTMTLPFMDTGDIFSNARKQFHLGIGPSAVGQYNRDYEEGSRRFVRELADDLECRNLDKTIDDSLGHVFLKVSTGYNGPETESILTRMNDLAHFAADVLGDKFQTLDVIPALAWLPTWVPKVGPLVKNGRDWKTKLHATAATTVKIMEESKAEGKMSVMSATCSSSAQGAAAALDKDDRSSMIAVTMNAGGMLATESATLTFLLAMARFPEIQKRAQAEVDAVLGGKRLPTMADRPRLPYVDAVLSEVLRWVSIAPVIGREVNHDDHYNGYLIPKGATIMANNWAISRDERMFPEPDAFRPERFLDAAAKALRTDVLPPMQFAFGFGHRTCPGRFLADALLFCHFAHVLAVFDVALPSAGAGVGEEERAGAGKERAADAAMKVKSNGAACRLEEVYVTLRPRSDAALALLAEGGEGEGAGAIIPPTPVPNGHANGNAAH